MKKTLVIGEDLTAFLGYDSNTIAEIDIEASKESYEQKVADRVFELYPDVNIEFDWDNNAKSRYDEFENPEEIQSDLEIIEDCVYNKQDFWVMKG